MARGIRTGMICFMVLACQDPLWPQVETPQDSINFKNIRILQTMNVNGMMVPYVVMDDIYVFPPRKFKNNRQRRIYGRLVNNVKLVYPYAKEAKNRMDEMEAHLATLQTEKERQTYIDQVEKKLFDDFEDDVRGLTITQGRILIKLIDRETGNTSYNILKNYKGSFTAFFWQSIARVFGTNLKEEYDRYGEDQMIEEIVLMIQYGYI